MKGDLKNNFFLGIHKYFKKHCIIHFSFIRKVKSVMILKYVLKRQQKQSFTRITLRVIILLYSIL